MDQGVFPKRAALVSQRESFALRAPDLMAGRRAAHTPPHLSALYLSRHVTFLSLKPHPTHP